MLKQDRLVEQKKKRRRR
jgi:hypothetical protein